MPNMLYVFQRKTYKQIAKTLATTSPDQTRWCDTSTLKDKVEKE